jgi:predicted ester cyclase
MAVSRAWNNRGVTLTAGAKEVVTRMIDEVINGGRLEVIDEIYSPEMAAAARKWIEPFRVAFPDARMQTVELVAEGERVAARFLCSGTQLGPWRGKEPTGKRMHDIDEVYFFTVRDGRITEAWGLEDTAKRLRQLGL